MFYTQDSEAHKWLFMTPKRGGNLHISKSFPLRNCARYTFYIFTYYTNEFLKFSNLIPVTHSKNLKVLISHEDFKN